MNNITYAVSVDVNNPIIPYNVYVANVLDSNVRYLEITLYQNGNVIALSNEATATASLVTDDVLIDDSVECTISNNIISVPLEDLQRHGNLDVQVTVTEGEKVLAIPFPIQVRVTPNIAEEAQIDDDSLGSYAEVVREIAAARGDYPDLKGRIDHTGTPTDEQVATAVSDWLDDHPEATTTVQDHSLTHQKLVKGTLGYITPEMFGAVGDGVTDDSTAIQNAFNYLKTHNLTLKLNGNYKINNQISVTNLHDRVINFGSSEITIRSSEYPDIFKVIEFKNCQHLTLLNGNFYSPRNQYAVAQGTHTRYGNPSDTEDTAGNGKCSNVHCFTFYGCDYITLSNISFDGFRFDIATNIINSVKEDDGVTLKINRDFTIENIKSVNTSTSIDLLYLERAQIKGCSIKMAERLGLGDHGIYVAHDCHDIHISKLYYESDGYCGSAIQFWNNVENENYVEDINAGDYVDGTVSDSVFYCPMIYTGRYSRCEFDNITFNNVKYEWETGEAKVIALDRHAKLIVSDSRFNDGEKLLSTQKYNSVTTNGSFTNVRFENCQINNFTNSVLNFSANSLTSEVAECTDNTVECFNCEFNGLQKCAATNSHANSFMKFYNCKFSLLDAGANSTNYLSRVVYTNSKNEFHNCHADYIGSLTTNSYVIYNGSNSGTYREGVNPATAPTLFTFCYFTGFGGGMANDQSYTAVATYINGTGGNDYILTAQDKSDIANIVLGLLPTTQGVQYGNQSN